jgi:hypothetical protein
MITGDHCRDSVEFNHLFNNSGLDTKDQLCDKLCRMTEKECKYKKGK